MLDCKPTGQAAADAGTGQEAGKEETMNICDNCERDISAEQARLLGCCSDCERALRASWATLDRESARTWGDR